MSAPDKPPVLMFAEELLGVFIRWSDESDLEPLEMAEAAAAVINNFCDDDDAIVFDADPQLLDDIEEQEDA
tara:strand:+ start:885 stop:1097 length:213 start_codon:yes stop_codon:yes gene_type:complete